MLCVGPAGGHAFRESGPPAHHDRGKSRPNCLAIRSGENKNVSPACAHARFLSTISAAITRPEASRRRERPGSSSASTGRQQQPARRCQDGEDCQGTAAARSPPTTRRQTACSGLCVISGGVRDDQPHDDRDAERSRQVCQLTEGDEVETSVSFHVSVTRSKCASATRPSATAQSGIRSGTVPTEEWERSMPLPRILNF